MHRRAGLAFGMALTLVAGLSAAACGQGDTSESSANSTPRAPEAEQTAQTTPATQPVVRLDLGAVDSGLGRTLLMMNRRAPLVQIRALI